MNELSVEYDYRHKGEKKLEFEHNTKTFWETEF